VHKNVFHEENILPTNFLSLLMQYIFLFHVAIDLKKENLVLEIWVLMTQLRSTIGCVNYWQKPAGSVLLSICFTLLSFSIQFTFQLLLTAMNLRSIAWGTVGLTLLRSLKTCMWYIWHTSCYLYYDYAVSLTRVSVQLHRYATWSKWYDEICSCNHCSYSKTKSFHYLPGMDFNMK